MINVVRGASLTNYAEIARRVGLDPARMLSEFGLPQRCLQDPELKVPMDPVRQLLEASAERSHVEGFGLLMAEARQLSDLGALGLLIREQPTLRLAIEAFVRHGRRLNDALLLTVEESGDVIVLREELIVGRSGSVRQSTELAIGVAYRMLRSFLGPNWRPRRVCFAHDPPRDRTVHERVFGRNVVEFGHDFNGIVCARRDLEVPNPDADPEIARLAQPCSTCHDREPAMSSQVRDLVVRLLGTAPVRSSVPPSISAWTGARSTAISRKGETFSGIVEAVRRELAERYVNDRHRSLAEVSTLLGFAAPSGFALVPTPVPRQALSGARARRTARKLGKVGPADAPAVGQPQNLSGMTLTETDGVARAPCAWAA